MNLSQLGNALIALGVLCFGAVGVLYLQDNLEHQTRNPVGCTYQEKYNYNRQGIGVLEVIPAGKFYETTLEVNKSMLAKGKRFALYIRIENNYDYLHTDFIFKGYRANSHSGRLSVQIGSHTTMFDFSQLLPQNDTYIYQLPATGKIKLKSEDSCLPLQVYFQRSE